MLLALPAGLLQQPPGAQFVAADAGKLGGLEAPGRSLLQEAGSTARHSLPPLQLQRPLALWT